MLVYFRGENLSWVYGKQLEEDGRNLTIGPLFWLGVASKPNSSWIDGQVSAI